MTVEDVSNQTDHFSHGKGGKDRSDPEAFDVAEEEEGQSGSHGEAGHVEGDLDSGVGYFEDLSCFTREQVGRDDRESAAVGECNSDAEDDIAHDKVTDLISESHWKTGKGSFVDIQHLAEGKADYEAEEVGRNEFFSKDHQDSHECALENVGPGAECHSWE